MGRGGRILIIYGEAASRKTHWQESWFPGEWLFEVWDSPLREEDIREAVRKMDVIVLDPSQYKVIDDPLQLQG